MIPWWVVPAVTATAGAVFIHRLLSLDGEREVEIEVPEIPRYRPTLSAIKGIARDWPVHVSVTSLAPPPVCAVCRGPQHPAHGVAYWHDPDGVVRTRDWCVLGLRPLIVATVSRAAGDLVVELHEGDHGE